MRTYELMVVLDPRMSEDEAAGLTDDIRTLLGNSGAEILKTDVWGRRKLAYEIQKLTEGRYVLFYLSTEDGNHSLPTVERRLQQHDQVLRYLTVRTDEDLRRAGLPLPTAEEEEAATAAEDAGEAGETDAAGDAGEGADDGAEDGGESAGSDAGKDEEE
jgi:small subunit ribosomal protein S6